jgi:hypothetical protein
MGKRWLLARYPLNKYSDRRAWLRLHEGDFEPHQIRPYGLASGKFSYRQMFQKKKQARRGNRAVERAVKKAAHQQVRQHLLDNYTWFLGTCPDGSRDKTKEKER